MQFVDINCMIGEWGFGDLRFKTAEQLQQEMQRLNIGKALVFHSRAWLYDPKSGNEAIVEETKGFDDFIPVISLTSLIDQEFGGRSAIADFIKRNGVGAVRLFPEDHHYSLMPWNAKKLFSVLNELGIPVLLECRQLEGAMDTLLQQAAEIAGLYENTPIILLAPGYRSLRMIYDLLDKCGNVHLDTSTFITFRGIEDVVSYFGASRILFGSRMPFQEGGVSVGRIAYADISREDKERIAYGNALDLLRKLPWLKIEGGGDK